MQRILGIRLSDFFRRIRKRSERSFLLCMSSTLGLLLQKRLCLQAFKGTVRLPLRAFFRCGITHALKRSPRFFCRCLGACSIPQPL